MIAEKIKNILPVVMHNVVTIGEAPTDADVCVALTEFGGPHGTYFSGDRMDTPYLKIFVRDPDFVKGYTHAKICKDILASYTDGQTLSIVLKNDIVYLGRDIKRRNEWQLIFKIFSNIDK